MKSSRGILSRLTIRRMVEFYEQEDILVASEGLSLYLHEARDPFYDPIRNERVTTVMARRAGTRANHENENRYCSWNLPRLAALILNCDSYVFDFQENGMQEERFFYDSTAVLECLNLI